MLQKRQIRATTLGLSISGDITLRRGEAGVAGELLHVAQTAAALDDLARGLGDEGPPAGMRARAYAMVFGTGEDRAFIDTALAVIAVIVWLVGRACRYVLAGR
jgi:hypothetical protein